MQTLYIHSMGNRPQQVKLKLIQNQGFRVSALHLNYDRYSFDLLKNYIQKLNIRFLIGQAHGGFLAFWLAEELALPCLLINPSLSLRAKKRVSPNVSQLACPLCLVGLSEEDENFDPNRTIKYLKLDKREGKTTKYKMLPGEKHILGPKAFKELLVWAQEELNGKLR